MNLPLKIAFVENGIKQLQAAMDFGISPSRLNKIINGWVAPTTDEQKMLSDYLGVPGGIKGGQANAGV
jgi:plasmid maintenance system antidote protein VapI